MAGATRRMLVVVMILGILGSFISEEGQDASRLTLSYFGRVSVIEKDVRVITCDIPKNGITLLNRIIATVLGRTFEWKPANPSTVGLSQEAFKDRLGNASNSWRKVVVYRDPMERFLSAYRFKCLLADGEVRAGEGR